MRIAIIAEVFLPKIDGVVNRTVQLIHELVRNGDQVMVICPRSTGSDGCGVPVVECRSFPFVLYPEYRIGLPGKSLVTAIERFSPDVLHFVNPFAFGFRCYDAFRKAGHIFPTVFSFHTLYGEFVKQYRGLKQLSKVLWWMTREYHNRADVNVTVSSLMQEELVQRGFRRVRCWPPAVDARLFEPSRRTVDMRSRLTGGRPEKPLLLTVSRLAPEKNVGLLAGVLEQTPGVCLAIVGDGPQRAELEHRFDGTDTRFIGYLKGVELAAAYASADAFIYASETETMGNVVLEAMACGRPVIVPRAGGIPNLVDHGRTGLLFTPRDIDEAAQFARAVLNDPLLQARLGMAGREAVRSWDWQHSVGKVREFYAEAIATFRTCSKKKTWSQMSAGIVTATLVSAFRAGADVRKYARHRGRSKKQSAYGSARQTLTNHKIISVGAVAESPIA